VNTDKLVRMANQIAANFAYLPDQQQAVARVTDHLTRFWDPLMRAEIREHLHSGDGDLSEIARVAVESLKID